jgi:hypothetical protein
MMHYTTGQARLADLRHQAERDALARAGYATLMPVETRVLGPAAPGRGGRPSGVKVLLELTRSVLPGAVIAGWLARAICTASARRCCSAGVVAGVPVCPARRFDDVG